MAIAPVWQPAAAPLGVPDQTLLCTSVRRFLEAFSRRRSLCVIFDDIQWAADNLLELIEAVAATAREAPLLLLTLARPELLDRRPDWGRGSRCPRPGRSSAI